MKRPVLIAFALAVVLLGGRIACLWRGELPPTWLAFSTCAAVLAVAGLALVDVWRQR